MFYSPPGFSVHGNCPGNTGVACHALLQGIFPTQGLNPGFLHYRRILYSLSHQGPQEYWSGYPFPSPGDLPDRGIKLRFPALQVDTLPAELSGKPKMRVIESIS